MPLSPWVSWRASRLQRCPPTQSQLQPPRRPRGWHHRPQRNNRLRPEPLRAEPFHKLAHKLRNAKALPSWSRRRNPCPCVLEELSSPSRAVITIYSDFPGRTRSRHQGVCWSSQAPGAGTQGPGLCIPADAPGGGPCCPPWPAIARWSLSEINLKVRSNNFTAPKGFSYYASKIKFHLLI